MKILIAKMVIALIGAGSAAAFASGAGMTTEGAGLLVWAFIGFGVMVIALQSVPAMVLFASMLKGIFSSTDKEVTLTKH